SGRGEAQGCDERAGFTGMLPPPVPDKPEGIRRGHREAAIYRREPGSAGLLGIMQPCNLQMPFYFKKITIPTKKIIFQKRCPPIN
ncbi:hypothetical protein, partial [Enterobacter asburiae]